MTPIVLIALSLFIGYCFIWDRKGGLLFFLLLAISVVAADVFAFHSDNPGKFDFPDVRKLEWIFYGELSGFVLLCALFRKISKPRKSTSNESRENA